MAKKTHEVQGKHIVIPGRNTKVDTKLIAEAAAMREIIKGHGVWVDDGYRLVPALDGGSRMLRKNQATTSANVQAGK